MVTFISIAFVVVRLKIFKVSVTIQRPRNSPFWEVFGPLLNQYDPILPKFSTEIVFQQTKTLFKNFLKASIIYGKGTDPKLALLVQIWHLCSSWRWPKSKNIRSSAEKLQSLSYPNMSKWSLSLISLFREKYDYLLQYLGYFYLDKGEESKFGKYYFIHTTPGQLPVKH